MNKNRSCGSGWWVVLMTATLAVPALGDPIGLYNATLGQVVTSSTLKWTTMQKEAMKNYVVGATFKTDPIYICRAVHEGDMMLGQLRPDYSSCFVSGSKSYSVFDVLENIENASLINWIPWSRFHAKPNGAVVLYNSVDKIFIGRKASQGEFSHNIGRILYDDSLGQLYTFDHENKDLMENNGEILVEIEPVSYKLEDVVLDYKTQHVNYDTPFVIKEIFLKNTEEEAGAESTEIEYKYNYSLSWGHGHGISIGLPTTIQMADGTQFPPLRWNSPFNEERKELYRVEKFLQPGTACNVTLGGKYTERDVQYEGKLTTIYKMDYSQSRQMRGVRIENTLEVGALFGEVYFLSNNSLVPTTTTTTTTTTTSTTTLPPPTEEQSLEVDENEIASNDKPAAIELGMPKEGEGLKTDSAKGEKIDSAGVGGISNPNGANTIIVSISLFVPMLALLL